MTNQQVAPEALRPIARYKIGYATDDWGMRSSTPSGIPHHAGAWVRYEDHVAALVEAQQPAPSAAGALSDDLRDRLVAISEAIADQDDRAAQAMLREILAAPQPSPTPQADSQPAPVGARHPTVVHWRNNGIEACAKIADAYGFHDPARDMRALLTAPPADSVLEDADPIRALIAEHAAILDQNESAYFELCYHRATGWMAWITDKPLCMPPVVNPDRKVLAQGQGDTADEACRDAARKQGDA